MKNFNNFTLAAVVVIYFPDKNVVNNLNIIIKNFDHIVLVFNSKFIPSLFENILFNQKNIIFLKNKTNIGLSNGLNLGIKKLKSIKPDFIGLFDQDSLLPRDYSKKMINFIINYQHNDACLYCPNFFNLVTKRFNKIKKIKLLRLRSYIPDDELISFPSYSITSGSLIHFSKFKEIGYFDENLFIDLVDTEWCLRAQSYGYKIVQNNEVVIQHSLGEGNIKLLNFIIQIHSPLRLYYYLRNSIYLYSLPHVSVNWIFIDFFKNIFRCFFYILFVKSRPIYFKYIIKAIYHGLIKKMGKLED